MRTHKPIMITLSPEQREAADRMMKELMFSNRSAFFGYLIGEVARGKRPVGRPRKDADAASAEELPPEDAPRTLKNPYPELVPMADRKKLVNEYELMMLEEKKKLHELNS